MRIAIELTFFLEKQNRATQINVKIQKVGKWRKQQRKNKNILIQIEYFFLLSPK